MFSAAASLGVVNPMLGLGRRLALESRCTMIRTVGSNPTLSDRGR